MSSMDSFWDKIDHLLTGESKDPLDKPLLRWSSGKYWTLRNACEGTLIVGAIGSGKTSGSGATIAEAFLKNGFGGLVLCVKKDEPDLWEKLCNKHGRIKDLIRFAPESGLCFNPLEHERINENRVRLLMKLVELEAKSKESSNDSYWKNESQKLLRNLFEIASHVGKSADAETMGRMLNSAPKSLADAGSASWLNSSECGRLLLSLGSQRASDANLRISWEYFMNEFPNLNDRTRSIITGMVATIFDSLGRSPLRELFTQRGNISPQEIFAGKILVVDLSVEIHKEVGQYANLLWKFCFQRAIQERQSKSPCFLWVDEAQLFLNREDYMFQTTARASRCTTVYLTQNYPNLLDALGQNPTDSLCGNLKTKIFHQNGCVKTNEWAAANIGEALREKQYGHPIQNPWVDKIPHQAPTFEFVRERIIHPEKFNRLRTGGPHNKYIVEGYVIAPGMPFSTTPRRFHQEYPGKCRSTKFL